MFNASEYKANEVLFVWWVGLLQGLPIVSAGPELTM